MKPKFLTLVISLLVSLGAMLAAYKPAAASPTFVQRSMSSPVVKLPSFKTFVTAVSDGQAGVVRGVYVPQVLALPVQQQPVNNPIYVSSDRGVATQFRPAADYGVIGLLAHNYDSGALFLELKPKQEVWIVYGNGAVNRYVVDGLYRYQALEPKGIYSDFVALDTGAIESVEEVFSKMYTGADHVTFQTCIAKGSLLTWGRLFVVATPRPCSWCASVTGPPDRGFRETALQS